MGQVSFLSVKQEAQVGSQPVTASRQSPPSLTGPSDMQCFTVKPVMNLPRSYKDKPVPEQILK